MHGIGELFGWLVIFAGLFFAGAIFAEVVGAWWSTPRPSRRELRDARINDAIAKAEQAEKDKR